MIIILIQTRKSCLEANTKAALRFHHSAIFKFDMDKQTFSRFILYYRFSYYAIFTQ